VHPVGRDLHAPEDGGLAHPHRARHRRVDDLLPHQHAPPRDHGDDPMNEFLLRTADGVDLSCAVTTGSAKPEGAVVIAHGFTATQDDPNVTELRTTLVDAGLDVVTFDARGHGESGGACTLGMDERHDVAAAVDVARTRADKVVVVGASMGAIAALGHSVDDT